MPERDEKTRDAVTRLLDAVRRFADYLGRSAADSVASLPWNPALLRGETAAPSHRGSRESLSVDALELARRIAGSAAPGLAEEWPGDNVASFADPPRVPSSGSVRRDEDRPPPVGTRESVRAPDTDEIVRRVGERLDLEYKRRTSLSLTEALQSVRDRLRRDGAA